MLRQKKLVIDPKSEFRVMQKKKKIIIILANMIHLLFLFLFILVLEE